MGMAPCTSVALVPLGPLDRTASAVVGHRRFQNAEAHAEERQLKKREHYSDFSGNRKPLYQHMRSMLTMSIKMEH
jgi:hypothetical protein